MSESASKAVFLSYASQDAEAAKRICETLRAAGVEVWLDQDALVGGDAWDQKIRGQITACTLFMPVISANTQARDEGYFRLEWKLAVDRSHLIAHDKPFLLPVVIDATSDAAARVPPEFRAVQWTRLPGGDTPEKFCARVKKLLAGEIVAKVADPGPASSKPATANRPSSNPWLVPTILGVAAMVAVAIWQPWRNSSTTPAAVATPPPVAANATAAPVSEARQLVAKARALIEPWDLASREDFNLAEQFLKKAVELDPTDGDAWAAFALFNCAMVVVNSGYADDHKQIARAQAERALKLAPNSGEARFVRAFSLRFSPQTQDEAIRLLREEAARQPTNHLVMRILGNALRSAGQYDQSLIYLDKALALSPTDPITLYNRGQALIGAGRMAEAESAIDEALALAPEFPSAVSWKIALTLAYHGDLTRAQSQLTKFRSDFFANEAGAVVASTVWLFSREPTKCLEALRPTRDYIEYTWFRGPKSYLTGMAQQLAGNEEAARADWRAALQLVEQKVATTPSSSELLWWRSVLLALLGERAEAETRLREILQRQGTGDPFFMNIRVARVLTVLGKKDEAIAMLEKEKSLTFDAGNFYSVGISSSYMPRNELRFDPIWDQLRGNPRFEALLKVPDQKK